MNKIKLLFAKIILKILKLKNPNAGSALPGYILNKIDKNALKFFTKQLDYVILITGTNGKTTTKTLISKILLQAEIPHITNHTGSNMIQGLLSTFIQNSNVLGKLNSKFAVLEVEEATLPKISKNIKANILIVTNLFRDQLDAYGEVNKTFEYIKTAINNFRERPILILNGDDPLVSKINFDLQNKTYKFIIQSKNLKDKILFENKNTKPFFKKQDIIIKASNIFINDDLTTKFKIQDYHFHLNISGFFQIYNALSTFIVAKELKIKTQIIKKSFLDFKPAFGRGEILNDDKNTFQIFLVKNPAGLTVTLNSLNMLKKEVILFFILNDKIADGRDISWIWDANIELLNNKKITNIFISGTRYLDMTLRLKYALNKQVNLIYNKNIKDALKIINQKTKDNSMIYVLPTYTAMNEFRSIFNRKF